MLRGLRTRVSPFTPNPRSPQNESLRKACRKAKRAFREAEKANEEVVGGGKAAKDVDCASSPVSVGDLKAQIKKTR